METLTKTLKSGTAKLNLKEAILAELHGAEHRVNLLTSFLNQLGGISDVRVHEAKTSGKARRKVHRGGPAALYEALKTVNGEFNVDRAFGLSKENKLDLDRVAVMNAIQSLIKRGKISVVRPGVGRTIAVYQLSKSAKKEVATG